MKPEKIKYVVENQKEIISLKKAKMKYLSVQSSTSIELSKSEAAKGFKTKSTPVEGELLVKLIGNTYGWYDHDQDVLIKDCFKQSIKDNPNIFHLHDHLFQLAAKVGEPQSVYEQELSYSELGIEGYGDGKTQCLVVESIVKKSLNSNIFSQYKDGEIDQHSVGMRYGYLVVCVNSTEPAYKLEYANWKKYFPYVINKDKCEEEGYFFAVLEASLKEVSCVLMGANEITPTLEVQVSEENKSLGQVDEDEDTEDKNAGGSSVDMEVAKSILAKTFLPYYLKS